MITYQRNAGSSYMILPQTDDVEPFEEEMLQNNEIAELLVFFGRRVNGQRELWYDITGKKSFRHWCEQGGLEKEPLCTILLGILDGYRRLEEYLISDTRILLTIDTLYLSEQENKLSVFLCFEPGGTQSLPEQLRGLYEYLMPLIDAGEEALVRLIYEGYEALSEESFSMDEFEKQVRDVMGEGGEEAAETPIEEELSAYIKDEPSVHAEPPYPIGMVNEPALKDEDRKAMIEELFEDHEEAEAKSFGERIRQFFAGAHIDIFGRFRKKKEEIFPPKGLEEDLIYDPSELIPAPTVLLAEDATSCFGKLIYEGDGDEKDYLLDKNEYRIGGRDRSNDVVLHSAAVSRQHARIRKKGKEFYLEDMGSTNGTFVNGEAVEAGKPRELHYMDKIVFADVNYRIV